MNAKWVILLVGVTLAPHSPAQSTSASPTVDVELDLSARSGSINHRIVDGRYVIQISHSQVIRKNEAISLSVKEVGTGKWGKSAIEHGDMLTVKWNNQKEPRGCTVAASEPISLDPAEDYVNKVFDRISQEGLTDAAARNEIDRLTQSYVRSQDHVLKLPRSARNRSAPRATLARLCRWIAYDKLFFDFGLKLRPLYTETDAKTTYEQLLKWIHEDQRPASADESMITDEELQAALETIRFVYTANFLPELADQSPDNHWRHAGRIRFANDSIGRLTWRGTLGTGITSSAWIAFPSTIDPSKLQIKSDAPGSPAQVAIVHAEGDWHYLRVSNSSTQTCEFKVQVIQNSVGADVEILHSEPRHPRFPF